MTDANLERLVDIMAQQLKDMSAQNTKLSEELLYLLKSYASFMERYSSMQTALVKARDELTALRGGDNGGK